VDGLLFAGEDSGHELAQLRTSQVPLGPGQPHLGRRAALRDPGTDARAQHARGEPPGRARPPAHRPPGRTGGRGHRPAPPRRLPNGHSRRRPGGWTALRGARRYTPPAGSPRWAGCCPRRPRPPAVFVAKMSPRRSARCTPRTPPGCPVPRDLSVVAVHDMPLASHLVPALTTVRMPLEELGRRAWSYWPSAAPRRPSPRWSPSRWELIVRESTAPPAS